MGQQVEIRSNILGDIAKIRQGVVFQNYETVVAELLQNSQRARAENIKVRVQDDVLVVEDDGRGCPDPQAVFEKNTSAWGNVDDAFGEGFFSVFLLADYLRVESADWKLSLDVLEMMRTGNLRVTTRPSTFRQGFRVEIRGKRVRENRYTLQNEAVKLGKIAPYNIEVNEYEVEKRPLLEPRGHFHRRFDNEFYEGVLSPVSSVYGQLEMFYDHRPVRSDFSSKVNATVHFKPGGVTLKAPDRRELIWDDKRRAFERQLEADARSMYREFLLEATDDELERASGAIAELLDVEDYLPLLRVDASLFDVFRYESEALLDGAGEPSEKYVAEVHEFFQSLVEGVGPEALEKVEGVEPLGPRLIDIVDRHLRLVWTGASEVGAYHDEMREAEYYGFKVIVAKNRLYENAFRHLGLLHIDEMGDRIQREFSQENVGARSRGETRLLKILERVGEHFNLRPGSIEFADLSLTMTMERGGRKEVLSTGGQVHGLCDHGARKIYLDRSLVDWILYAPDSLDTDVLTTHDYRALLRVMKILSHELAHLLFATRDNTREQIEMEYEIYEEIVRLF